MNVATYGFTIVAARLLGPASYGGFASAMAMLLVLGVLQLGLQATAARRISADPDHVAQIERSVLSLTYRAALGIGLLMLLLSPLVAAALRLESALTAAVVALAAVPLTVMGGMAGILQGERRWRALALVYASAGLPRLAIGTGIILVDPGELQAVLGVALAAFVPVLVARWALRHPRAEGLTSEAHELRPMLREALHNSSALLAFFALSSADLVVSRNVLPDHESGLYAGGLILTKALLFLPQFVVVLAFPAMSSSAERRRALTRSLTLIVVLGAVGTAAAWLLSGLALVFVGGSEYQEIESRLWLFAVLGTVLSMLQLMVYAVIAGRRHRSVSLIWVALVGLVGVGLLTETINQLILAAVGVNVALLAALLVITLRAARLPVHDEGEPEPPVV